MTTKQIAEAVGVQPRAVQQQCAARGAVLIGDPPAPAAVRVETQRGMVWDCNADLADPAVYRAWAGKVGRPSG